MIINILIIIFFIVFFINLIFNFIFITKEYNIKFENLKNDLKIIHLSDIHCINSKRKENSLLNKIQRENPNIIVITGDLVDATDYNHGRCNKDLTIDFLKKLAKIAKTYFVYGNHEVAVVEDKDTSFLKDLENTGIILLNNKAENIEINENNISIFGIQDPQTVNSYIPFENTIKDELDFVKNKINENSLKIFLVHRPEYFEIYSKYDIDLCLSGHAHGGQFRFPLVKGLYAPNQGWFPKYTKGEYELNNTKMIVSPGLGNSCFKFRIFNPLEIGIINLKK